MVILEPGCEMCTGGYCCRLLLLACLKVLYLLVRQVHLQGHDCWRPVTHGQLKQSPACLAGPYRAHVLVLSDFVTASCRLTRGPAIPWCFGCSNHLPVVTLVHILEQVLDGFHRPTYLYVYVGVVPEGQVGAEWDDPAGVDQALPHLHLDSSMQWVASPVGRVQMAVLPLCGQLTGLGEALTAVASLHAGSARVGLATLVVHHAPEDDVVQAATLLGELGIRQLCGDHAVDVVGRLWFVIRVQDVQHVAVRQTCKAA